MWVKWGRIDGDVGEMCGGWDVDVDVWMWVK